MIAISTIFSACYTINEELYLSAGRGNLSDVQKYVRKGANVNYKDPNTILAFPYPILWAAYEGYFDIVKYLADMGADITVRDSIYGDTVLIYAAYHGNLSIVQYLVQKGADINLRGAQGRTAMSVSYARGNLQVYNYLKEHGAIEFEPLQVSSTSSTSSSNSGGGSYNQSSSSPNTAQQIQDAFKSPIDGGTYTLSGKGIKLQFTTIASSGMITYTDANGKVSMCSYSINGNIITFNFPSGRVTGQIISRTSFVTNDGLWNRTGF